MLRRNPDAALEVIKYPGSRSEEAQGKAKNLTLARADQPLTSLLVDLATRNRIKNPTEFV